MFVPKAELEFTPLEFETRRYRLARPRCLLLEFTPLEFETKWWRTERDLKNQH